MGVESVTVAMLPADKAHGDARVRENAGLADFYAAAYPRLVTTLRRVHPNAAEELAQEAFIRLLPRWSRISRYDDPEAWLRRVAFRLGASQARRQSVLATLLRHHRVNEVARASDPNPTNVSDLIARLPVGQREVIVLFYLYDKSVQDIGRELSISTGTVKSRLSRARSALRDMGAE